jgi:3-carboxy-cis,cis-muconate cycloisomerase
MTSHLVSTLGTTQALAGVFSDVSMLQAMLDFELALARAEARVGLIPQHAAEAIRTSARARHFDAARIAGEARESGSIAIPLVRALTAHVRAVDSDSARFVHWGATSQDVVDSALVLALRRAMPLLAADHQRLVASLRLLSDSHAGAVMLGRTLLQPAPPITFGLKSAGWIAALRRGWERFERAHVAAMVVQLGGASGTLAAFGDRGLDVLEAVARELDLAAPPGAWHTDRDRLAAVLTSAGIYTATLGKIARDLSLLMQDEVGESAEPGGGSSTLPHKRNPASCAAAIAAATRMPGLVSAFLSGMLQEHERGVGGWHAEWPTVAAAVQSMGAAVCSLANATAKLSVHPDRMRENLARTNGVIFAERVMMLTVAGIGREPAETLVRQALDRTRDTGQSFKQVLLAMPEVVRLVPPEQLQGLDVPENYLGVAEALRVRLLG